MSTGLNKGMSDRLVIPEAQRYILKPWLIRKLSVRYGSGKLKSVHKDLSRFVFESENDEKANIKCRLEVLRAAHEDSTSSQCG